jgi:hypothetical protein
MKTKYFLLLLCVMTLLPLSAQETYQMANLETQDLNGSARFVGMGGAMGALGGDISVMGTNPAGVGIFRKSEVAGSFGFVSQQDAASFNGANKTNMSFDQIGFVWANKTNNRGSRLNFGFNFHKSRNFDNILSAAGSLNGNSSQNKLTATKFNTGIISSYDKSANNGAGGFSTDEYTCNQLDQLYVSNLLESNATSGVNWYDADSYTFGRSNKGYIGSYDFNISGSIRDRVFIGLTLGLSDVHYRNYSVYSESMNGGSQAGALSTVDVTNREKITGTGFDAKFGVIFRPIAESPFRIGLSVTTPTFYDLSSHSTVALYANGTAYGAKDVDYDFKFYTPWKFGLSLGETIGNYIAIGAEYEYADYGSTDARIDDGDEYDSWNDTYYSNTHSDEDMNQNVDYSLKGVSTVKLGFEFKPDPAVALRIGYNYISPIYSSDGYRDPAVYSLGNYSSTTSDYVNWKCTNRITAGFGYRFDNAYIDLAYQYTTTDGDFYPFTYSSGNTSMEDNMAGVDKVSNKRHQLICTLGFKF